MNISKK